jgi:sulfopyruvate decarboxylase TPP-binding subunit
MLDGPAIVSALRECGISHVVWLPDTALGTWDAALSAAGNLQLIRVCREGEAFAVAAGLLIGGKKPIVLVQCTGLFEAGDSLRNVVHDMGLPVFFIVGVRSYYARQQGKSNDSCAVFTEPIVKAWQIPYVIFEQRDGKEELVSTYRRAQAAKQPMAILLAE